jgi:hypothetical protein
MGSPRVAAHNCEKRRRSARLGLERDGLALDEKAHLARNIEPAPNAGERYEFSVMPGGPLFHLYCRARLSGLELELVTRRLVIIPLLAWLPLLVLSGFGGHLWSGVNRPFLLDVDVHVRLLLALPLLIYAELHFHRRMRMAVQFIAGELADGEVRSRFDDAVAEALRLRSSITAELVILALVYAVGIAFVWRELVELRSDSWYRLPGAGDSEVTPAGWWYALASLPLFQFLLFRWYFRLGIWARFLYRLSRMGLKLQPVHPDECGGLGFLDNFSYAFVPLLLAHGALFAGVAAGGIFFEGRSLFQYGPELVALPVILALIVIAPLLAFFPTLARLKRRGLIEYGALAQRYDLGFDEKWVRGRRPEGEAFLGSADIQSLADLGNSYGAVAGMRMLPIRLVTTVHLVIVILLPVLPLVFTVFSARELAARLLRIVF